MGMSSMKQIKMNSSHKKKNRLVRTWRENEKKKRRLEVAFPRKKPKDRHRTGDMGLNNASSSVMLYSFGVEKLLQVPNVMEIDRKCLPLQVSRFPCEAGTDQSAGQKPMMEGIFSIQIKSLPSAPAGLLEVNEASLN